MLALILVLQSPGDSLTLVQALARARAARPQLRVAAAKVAEARAALRTAGAVPNPTVSYSRSESFPRNHLLVDQSLDWLLRRDTERAAARAGIDRARADSIASSAQLFRDVRLGFYRARAARLTEELVGGQAALADSVARIAGARLRAGDISRLEAEQAEQEAARARQTASAAREEARVAEADLARALGWEGPPPHPSGPLDDGLEDALLQPAGATLDSNAIPAVRAAVADSAAAAAQLRLAARVRIPVPTLQTGAEWDDPSQPGALSVIGLAVPLPLWNRGGGPQAEAQARAEQSAALARESRLEADRAMREARIRLEETAGRARFARDSLLPGAVRLRERALRAYRAGETGILPALDALRSERDVSLAALQDQLAFQQARAEWLALMGRAE